MRVLGITTEGDSGAAIVEDGRILAAVNEERLSRLKLVVGFPRGAIREVMDLSATTPDSLDAVVVAAERGIFVDELQPFDGWQQLSSNSRADSAIKRLAGPLSRFQRNLPWLEAGYYALLSPKFSLRQRRIEQILRDEFSIRCPVKFVDHHFAHLTSAYFTSGFENALVVSIDGGGDGRSSLIATATNGRLKLLHEVSSFNSLGNYYAYVTDLCGFKAMKHEGKITGLAGHGEPKYLDLLEQFVDEAGGTIVNRAGLVFRAAADELRRQLPQGWAREDLAASIQRHFERVVRRYVRFWAQRTGLRDLAVAGGVFANVRVNQEVLGLAEIDRFFVHPHMSDGGLSVGAALAACVPGVLDRTMPRDPAPLSDVYLGRDLTEEAIEQALSKYGLRPEPTERPIEDHVADLLSEGHVVARAAGRMEYGPRALGNRSILYKPTDPSVNDWLNENLQRTEFMPFAPATLYEARDDCFFNVGGGEHAAEFMTITFDCKPWMRTNLPGVVHVDGTARPQLVREETNPSYYRIIRGFRDRTGLPAVINTSFNMHGEPIVNSADDCVRAFLQGNLDYLAIGSYLIRHPEPLTHPLQPVGVPEAVES